mmetsp:Transcript_21997/g.61541  ORF Transcript_21997/g.61541 Transcript_21997/m.61541 type:complete len:240 (+) Transcript_21997:136-855(+)
MAELPNADGSATIEKVASAPDVNAEEAHRVAREKMMAVAAQEEAEERARRKRRREMKVSGLDVGAAKREEKEKKVQQEKAMEHLETINSKFGLFGGDEFKQVALADQPDKEEAEARKKANEKEAKDLAEAAAFQQEQAALEEARKQRATAFQEALQAKAAAELAKKRGRPGVKLGVKKGADGGSDQVAPEAEPVSVAPTIAIATEGGAAATVPEKAGGLGLGGYDSDDSADDGSGDESA